MGYPKSKLLLMRYMARMRSSPGQAFLCALGLVSVIAMAQLLLQHLSGNGAKGKLEVKLTSRGVSLEATCTQQVGRILSSNSTFGPGLALDLRLRYHNQQKLQRELERHLIRQGIIWVEGNSGAYPDQQRTLLALAASPCVKHVCEVGFNAGHSATVWLSAQPSLRVSAFDLGAHNYTRAALAFLTREPHRQRINVTFGNSLQTLPRAASEPGRPSCELMLLDGGHDFRTVMADLINMRALAAAPFHLLVVDDVHCSADWCHDPTSALEAAVKNGLLEVLKVYRSEDGRRGFAVGRYLMDT